MLLLNNMKKKKKIIKIRKIAKKKSTGRMQGGMG